MNNSSNPRNTAMTSIMSYHEEKKNFPNQEKQVLDILKDAILTARQVNIIMCRTKLIDISSTHRAINSLGKKKKLIIAKRDKCPITGKTVRHYTTWSATLF
jgi:hypothetical protein